VAELAEAVDRLLLLAPPADPPLGFESRAVAAITAVSRATGAPTTRRPGWLRPLVAAAAVTVALATGWVWATARSVGPGPAPVVATLHAGDGRDVGRAVLARGRPGWVVVDVTGLRGDETYRIEAKLASERSRQVGELRLAGGRGQTRVRMDTAGVTGVRLVAEQGEYECEAKFV
jgi:hypothetical protein